VADKPQRPSIKPIVQHPDVKPKKESQKSEGSSLFKKVFGSGK
jgi:hypothetical protein